MNRTRSCTQPVNPVEEATLWQVYNLFYLSSTFANTAWLFWFHNRREISWLAELLLASQEEFWSMKLVIPHYVLKRLSYMFTYIRVPQCDETVCYSDLKATTPKVSSLYWLCNSLAFVITYCRLSCHVYWFWVLNSRAFKV